MAALIQSIGHYSGGLGFALSAREDLHAGGEDEDRFAASESGSV
jgi:hypothetical protein